MSKTIQWGILGTGAIAKLFAEGLRAVPGARLAAVGSRTQAAAERFGAAHGVPRRHGSYEALAADPEVDIVYIATPHALHKDNSILCLRAGKHVLCEKPFTINAREAEELVAVARAEKRFLMEAMWTRFLPVMEAVRQWLREGAIGSVRMVQADFGFRAADDESSRLLDPALGGGSLLDVGVYPIAFAAMVYGRPPERMTGLAHLGRTGVDEQAAYVFGYPDGALALLSSAVRTNSPQEAVILGETGHIRVAAPFWNATEATLFRDGREPIIAAPRRTGNGYNYEAEAAVACLRDGRLEDPRMPLDESVAIMRTMDALRAQWGMKYPME